MRAYFDTSALIPLLIDEPGTGRCTTVWEHAGLVVSSALAYVEVHAAVAQAARQHRIDAFAHRRVLIDFAAIWASIARVAVSDAIMERAADLSAARSLRGYDAVHCATALAVASDDFVAVTGDRDLLRAWRTLGIATVDTSE